MKSLVQRNVCQAFSQLNSRSTYSVFNTSETLVLAFRNQCEMQTGTIDWIHRRVRRLHESCIVFRCIEFNQSDFDKPIMFVSLTIAHITISSLFLLSVCLVGSAIASPGSIGDRSAHTTYSLFPFSIPPLSPSPSAAWLPHITAFDSRWMRSLREALAPFWEFFC